MAENKKDKSSRKNAQHVESLELFERLYRKELSKISAGKKAKPAQKRDTKTGKAKKQESSSRFKGDRKQETVHQNGRANRKIIKRSPASHGNVDSLKEVSPKRDNMVSKALKEKSAPRLKDDKQGEITREGGLEIGETKSASVEFASKLGQNSDKLKIALLCLALMVALGFIINSLGVLDFGGLLGFSEQSEKGNMKTRIAQKSPQKGQSQKAPSKVSPSKVQPVPTKESTDPIATARRPAITQQRYRPAASATRPKVVQGPSKAAAPQQKPVVVRKPSQPSTSPQKDALSNKSSRTLTSKAAPIIAKRTPEPANSKAMPTVFQETPRPVGGTQEEEVSAKGELSREGEINTYCYSVYLGSYPSLKRANKAISGYRQRIGLSPYLIKVDLGDKGVWYRVLVGHYENRDEAEALIREKSLVDAEVIKTKEKDAHSVAVDKPQKEKSSLEVTRLSYPYSIYLGSYQTLDHAKEAISSYQKRGLSPYWVKLDLGDKGSWFRVFTGYFRSREQANDFIEKKHIGGAKSRYTKYANLIGTFASQERLDTERFRISEFGYCPYVIPGPDGELLLYVGAFYQKGRAQIQHAELASKGIHSQVVER